MRFFQASYGKPDNINWKLFNLSPGIPQDMCDFFEKVGTRNAPQNLNPQDMRDEAGNPLLLREICSQDRIIGLTQVQYGEVDNTGRPKITAHGFLFSADDHVLRDPNEILSVSDENFTFGSQATNPVDSLQYEPRFTLASAMETAGLSENNLLKLMACVNISLVSQTDYPLFLLDCREEQRMKAVMYCIYMALPYSLRYLLSFSNANNFSRSLCKSISFVRQAPTGAYWYHLDNGETNVELEDIGQNPDQYPFLYRLREYGAAQFDTYCQQLQAKLDEMQLSWSQDYETLKMADVMLDGLAFLQKKDDQKLTRFLFETVSYAPLQNQKVDDYLAQVLKIYAERGLVPNEILLKKLQVRALKTSSAAYGEIYRHMQASSLIQQGQSEVSAFLAQQSNENPEEFRKWCTYLEKFDNGHEMVGGYYTFRVSQSTSLDDLLETVREGHRYLDTKAFSEAILDKIQNFTRQAFTREFTGPDSCVEIQEACDHALSECFPQMSRQEIEGILCRLIDEYWDRFRFETFQFTSVKMTNYQTMASESHPTYQKVERLIRFYEELMEAERNISAFPYQLADTLSELFDNQIFTPRECDVLVPMIQKLVCTHLRARTNRDFVFWFNVADLTARDNSAGMEQMLRWNLPVLTDDDCFESALQEQGFLQNLDLIIRLIGDGKNRTGLLGKLDPRSDEFKLMKRRQVRLLNLQQEFEKAEKQRARSEEKHRRQQEKQQRSFPEEEEPTYYPRDISMEESRDLYSHSEDMPVEEREDSSPFSLKKLGNLFRGRKNK